MKHNISILTQIAALKFIFGLGTLGLAVYVEYLHEFTSGPNEYIKVALDHIAAMLAIASAATDFYAAMDKMRVMLNLKVGSLVSESRMLVSFVR